MPSSRCWFSTSGRPGQLSGPLRIAALSLVLCDSSQAEGFELMAVGQDHYLNQEYDQAVDSFQQLLRREPENPGAHVRLAKALLYRELAKLRLVDTSAFRDDAEFYEGAKPKPDPAANAAILRVLQAGRLLCQGLLQAESEDRDALHGLARLHALRATYEFMIGKDYFGALANGRRARKLSYQLAAIEPEFVDGLLVAGLDEYMLGSLPWAVRALIALSGYRGRKSKGLAMIERVAREGQESRDDARLLLTLAYRRERRYLDAAREFAALARNFPRAYAYPLEEAAMRRAAGERIRALEILREIDRKRVASEDSFDRMPGRWVAALRRTIAKLDREARIESR